MKTWLKGGLIGGIIGIIILILTFLPIPYIIRLHLIAWIIKNCSEAGCIIFLFTTPLFYFLLGSLIGFLVGKFKNKD